jgi:acetyl-CoA acyltransferase 2
MEEILILGGARTPFGTFGGALKEVTPTDLGTAAAKAAIANSGLYSDRVDQVIIGNVIHSTANASYLARHIALKAGIPQSVPAMAVNRLCGSGLQAVVTGAQAIRLGEAETVLAGGADNMSLAPHVLKKTRFGTGVSAPEIVDMLWATLTDEYIGCGMGVTAENLAKKYSITREMQDEFALESVQKASRAAKSGRLSKEITPISLLDRKGHETKVCDDEHIRHEATLEGLSKLKPAFDPQGTVTAGNASGINDGAAAVMIAGETFAHNNSLKPLARIVSWGVVGVDPSIMGIGPVEASRLALRRAGLNISDMDLVEVNEAFAAQYLAVEKELGLDRTRVNVNGGAIALGHPVGASGSRILYSLALELQMRSKRYGLASLCIGGGQGISMVIESCL